MAVQLFQRPQSKFQMKHSSSTSAYVFVWTPADMMHFDYNIHEAHTITILGMGAPNERRRYIGTSSHIDWAHAQDDPILHLLGLKVKFV